MSAAPQLLILGHGYSASYLTPLMRAEGWQVTGTTRNNAAGVQAAGATPLIWPGDSDGLRRAIDAADAILMSIAPNGGDPILKEFAPDLAQAIKTRPRWLGYLSTTAVYGDHHGAWVDENTPLTPLSRRGEERVSAEQGWQALAVTHDQSQGQNHGVHIFRLAGIYGPGRGPFAKLRAGTARRIIKPGQIFSRIHAEDIAQVLRASILKPQPGAVYNLCDDDPAPPEDVIAFAAQIAGLPLPPEEDFATADMTPMARSFYAESKRVSNAKIKADLGIRLIYPDYRSGLTALARQEAQRGA